MSLKDFWSKSIVGVIGGGSWGSIVAHLVSKNCRQVRVLLRHEEAVLQMNTTRTHRLYPSLVFGENVVALSSLERFLEGGLQALLWILPAMACREQAQKIAPWLKGDEIILHGMKGIEYGSLKRMSEVLREELPCRRIGVMSGPNLASEIAAGQFAAAVVASPFLEVCEAGQCLLSSDSFQIHQAEDVVGVEWAGVLKNILAILCGISDALDFGQNTRAWLLTRGIADMVQFGTMMGGQESTFLGLAGMGDILATCYSPLSRNYQVGRHLGLGKSLETVLKDVHGVAEGIKTAESICHFATQRHLVLPTFEGVARLIRGEESALEVIRSLMCFKN